METIINVKGMSCQHCVKRVTKTISAIEGITNVTVSLEAENAVIEHENADIQSIIVAVNDLGFEASL